MEDLTKQQLVLLALLVSFVASIATSIATASLLDQAPPRVTQTIHRVVERTVETVVPSDNGDSVVTETTVIVKEEDAITDTIADVSPRLVRLHLSVKAADDDNDDATTDDRSSRFQGLAVVTGAGGKLITASALIVGGTEETYEATLADGTFTTARVEERDTERGFASLTLDAVAGSVFPEPVVFGDDEHLRIGQTVLGLGGQDAVNVSIGIISGISTGEDGGITGLGASVVSDVAGMPLLNLFGEVVGFAPASGTQSFIPVSDVDSVGTGT